MKDQRELIVVVGRTASGKDTFIGRIETENRTMAKSYTTRPRRFKEGNTHIFIDSINGYEDRILETTINGYHYFLTREDLRNHDILLIDPKGVKDLINLERFNRPLRVIYLNIGKEIRAKRYMKRDNVTYEDFENRDKDEDSQFSDFEKEMVDIADSSNFKIDILNSDKDIDKLVEELSESR